MHDPADPATGRKLRHLFGSGGFGHAGAGGSHAFADPAHGLSFGYAMNRMDLNVLPGVKTRNLISAVMKEVAEGVFLTWTLTICSIPSEVFGWFIRSYSYGLF